MNDILPFELIEQAGIVVLLAIGVVYIQARWLGTAGSIWSSILFGFLFGSAAVLLMMDPIGFVGQSLDARAGPAVLAGVIGGPISAAVMAGMASAGQFLLIGGDTALGDAISFVLYGLVGVAYWWLRGTLMRSETGIVHLTILSCASIIAALPSFFIGYSPDFSSAMLRDGLYALAIGHFIGVMGTGAIILSAQTVIAIRSEILQQHLENERLALVAKHAGSAVVIGDKTGKIEWVNETFETMTGYTLAEVAGRRSAAILCGPSTDKAALSALHMAFDSGQPYQGVLQYYRATGEPYWVTVSLEPVVTSRGVQKYVSVHTDVTSQKRFEEHLIRAETLGRIGYWTRDMHSGHSEWSRETFSIFGIDPSDRIPASKDLVEIYHHEDRDLVQGAIVQAMREKTGFRYRCRIVADGKVKHVECIAEPEYGVDGEVRRFFGVIQDVSDSIDREVRLQEALRDSEVAIRTKSEFLATMSHELRTPLNAINGYSEIMLSGLFGSIENSRYRDYLNNINDSARYLREMIESILEFSSAEAGRKPLEQHKIHAAKLVEEAVALLKTKATDAGVDIRIDFTDEVYLYADKLAAKQVLVNCLDNAIKFSAQGRAVGIAVRDVRETVEINVEDTGVGIPAELLHKVTEPFVRGESQNAEIASAGGTGIGLAIVDRYMKAMGGFVSISSYEGAGTCVSLVFRKAWTCASDAGAVVPHEVKTPIGAAS